MNLRVKEVYKDYIVVIWDEPKSDGGSEITGYNVEKCDARKATYMSSGTTDAKTRSMKVSKLVEGNEYYIRVSAENDIGTSDPTTTEEPVKARLPFGKLAGIVMIDIHNRYTMCNELVLRNLLVYTYV